MAEPSPSKFEKEISEAADYVYKSGKTGYNWDAVDKILRRELDLEGLTRCKKANNSGRAANVLTESMDKPIQLHLIFIAEPYTIDRFVRVAKDRIKRFPNVKSVAIADRLSGIWRVRAMVERKGVGLASRIKGAFPALEDTSIFYVESALPSTEPEVSGTEAESLPGIEDTSAEGEAIPTVPTVGEDEFVSAILTREVPTEGLGLLPAELVNFATHRGLIVDLTNATDLLATALSSQLLLFAGPSGTGKSSMARLLSEFLAPADRRFEIEALRQWLTPDDLVGYYSVLSRQYASTSATQTLVGLHEASVASVAGKDGTVRGPSILRIEEMNLSAPEGYLAPIIHGLSGVSEPMLRWELHTGSSEAVDEGAVEALPSVALIGPYFRVFGTINVDASAHAPARKVAARSAVILLEPSELTSEELEILAQAAAGPKDFDEDPRGEPFFGDPLTALRTLEAGRAAILAAKLQEFLGEVGGLRVSRRDATRSLAYMAYFGALVGNEDAADESGLQLAVENAFAHCVLPTVEPGRFVQTLQALDAMDLSAAAPTSTELGGLLATRVERLLGIASHGSDLGGMLDFWSALS